MSKKITAAIAAIVLALLLGGCDLGELVKQGSAKPSASASADRSTVYMATVHRVVDGDTFTIEAMPQDGFEANCGTSSAKNPCREHTIRLLGVDAPEMNKMDADPQPECGAVEAKRNLASLLIKGKSGVTVKLRFDPRSDQRDKYGRSLMYAEIIQDGQSIDVGAELIKTGHAAAWYPRSEPKPERSDAYEQAEQDAISAKTGLHAVCATIGRS